MTDLRSTAEPITATIAEHVRKLRRRRRMNQTELADAMAKLGMPWKRATVLNLELRAAESRGTRHGRDSVSVGELLGLALVLGVQPASLAPELNPSGNPDGLLAKFDLLDTVEQAHVQEHIRSLIQLLLDRRRP